MQQVLLGERLKNAREASGMSQQTMATRLGVKSSTVEKWEDGSLDPRANRLQMTASMLNVPLMWLLAGSQKVPDPAAGVDNQEIMLQKIADLSSKIKDISAELDELKTLAQKEN